MAAAGDVLSLPLLGAPRCTRASRALEGVAYVETTRDSQGEGSLFRHRPLEKRELPREEDIREEESKGKGGREQKAKERGEGEREKSRRDQTERVRAKYLVSFPNEML